MSLTTTSWRRKRKWTMTTYLPPLPLNNVVVLLLVVGTENVAAAWTLQGLENLLFTENF